MAAECRLSHGQLKELHRIAGRIVNDDLLAADPGHDVVPEVDVGRTKLLDQGLQIGDLNRESIPPARSLMRSIGHRLTASGGCTGGAQYETEIAA